MTIVEEHFKKTKELLSRISKNEIAKRLLNDGYFPEQNILPPTFNVNNFLLRSRAYYTLGRRSTLTDEALLQLTYPKTSLTDRSFSIQHPHYYHDIVFRLMQERDFIIEHLFPENQKIFSYSFPIPLNSQQQGRIGNLRSGRMVYERISMAEEDLVIDAYKYNYIVRSDITNFYNSVYTHSIGRALHGERDAFNDRHHMRLLGCKIDKLVQYANRGRTNGIPIGSALSDLIAEIILAKIDLNISIRLQGEGIDFVGTRFKDDYRFLCKSPKDGNKILKIVNQELTLYNLLVNEKKTEVLTLPLGLYRRHNLQYQPFSLRQIKEIKFKEFEFTLLKVIEIHREYGGTSIIEKFLSELYDDNYKLKIQFANDKNERKKQILKTMSLLILLKNESEKCLSHILSIMELIYVNKDELLDIKNILKEVIKSEIVKSNDQKSIFALCWYVYFTKTLALGIDPKWLRNNIDLSLRKNAFLKSIFDSKQEIFPSAGIVLYRKPKDCKGVKLVKRLNIFEKEIC